MAARVIVVVPAVPGMLRAEVVDAIITSGFAPMVVPMTALDSYWTLLAGLWEQGVDFAVVEHDIVVDPDTLARFAACPELWCAHSYDVYAGDVAAVYGGAWSLGCVRFRAELMTRFGDLLERAGEVSIEGSDHPIHQPKSWGVLDHAVSRNLRARGVDVHQHDPKVDHLHRYDREGAWEPPRPVTEDEGVPSVS